MEIRIKNGRRYNTDTSKKIGTASDGMTLYRKTTGEFFLHRGEEKKVEILDRQAAQKWANDNLTAEECKAGFTYSEKSKAMLYNIPEYAAERLRDMAAEHDKPASEVLTDLIMNTDESRATYEKYKVRMVSAIDGAAYVGISVGSFKKWGEQIGAVRRFGRSVRYDLSVIDKHLDK